MKKTTSKNLTKKLSKYGALVAAIGGVAEASGQIVYTDIDPDFSGTANSEYLLDLNNDGTDDFRVHQVNYSYTTSFGYTYAYNHLYISPLGPGNEVLGEASGNFAYPFVLNAGDMISNGAYGSWNDNGFSGGFNSLNYGSCSFGDWCDITDGYLGLRFVDGGNTYYGWARLDVATVPINYAVKDYAYNTTPDQALEAGQQILGVEDNLLASTVKIVSKNKRISLYNLPENSSYKLISLTGQTVLNGNTNDSTHTIEVKSIATGVYVFELTDTNTQAIVKKKITL